MCGGWGGNSIGLMSPTAVGQCNGCQSEIAKSNSVTVGKSRANLVTWRCGKQLPVMCCLHLAALFWLFLDHPVRGFILLHLNVIILIARSKTSFS